MLGLASCQNDFDDANVSVGGEVDFQLAVAAPELGATRADDGDQQYGHDSAFGAIDYLGDEADNLRVDWTDVDLRYSLEVYDVENDYNASHVNPVKDRQVIIVDKYEPVVFDLRLVPNRNYHFVVFADFVPQGADKVDGYNTSADYQRELGLRHNIDKDLRTITLKNEAINDEVADAYFATKDIEIKNSAAQDMKLKRPYGKVRVIATDLHELNLNVDPAAVRVTYDAFNANGFNAVTGAISGKYETKQFVNLYNPVKKIYMNNHIYTGYNTDAYKVTSDNGVTRNKYMTIFTDYILASADQHSIHFTMEVFQHGDSVDNLQNLIKSTSFNTDIPVQRNYLTTVIGNVLTTATEINVTIDDNFDGEKNWPETNEEDLAYAAMFGGEVTLTEDIALTQPLEIVPDAKVVINLGGKTISNPNGYAIENYGTLTIDGDGNINGLGNIRSHAGKVTINGGTFTGSSDWKNGTYQHILKAENTEVVINGGTFDATIQGMTNAMINVSENSVVTINGGEFRNVVDGAVIPQFAPYMFTYEKNGKLIINDGDFYGGWRFNGETTTTDIYGGNFTVSYDGQSFHASSTHVLTVYGGVFDLNNGGKLNPTSHCADGYKAIATDGIYYVLPETIANAAEAEGVTAVTESTADVATALATNNGKATLFMWNDVAYIAKYGKVVITSDADEATTVRGVVESSTDLTSATVADGIEVVGNRTFRKCANLETVALPNTLTEIGPAVFQTCSKLANITIPASVTTIGESAFAECTALTSINIPASITRLEKDVLRNTGLVSIEIPASVNYIGTFAFRDCKQLKEVIINAPEFTVEANAFGVMAGALPGTTIYVANTEMKAYLESTLAYANQFTIVVL